MTDPCGVLFLHPRPESDLHHSVAALEDHFTSKISPSEAAHGEARSALVYLRAMGEGISLAEDRGLVVKANVMEDVKTG